MNDRLVCLERERGPMETTTTTSSLKELTELKKLKELNELNELKEYNDAFERLPGYMRHLDRIRNARVMVIGIGALGNEVVKNLTLFNVGHLFLCDFDTIETANLSHSVLFRPGDEGSKKVDIAKQRVEELNPHIAVTAFDRSLSEIGLGVWQEMDVIIGCLDNRGSRLLIDQACGRIGKDWIDAGLSTVVDSEDAAAIVGLLRSTVQIFSPSQGISYAHTLQSRQVRQLAHAEARRAAEPFPTFLHCYHVSQTVEKAGRIPTTPAMASLTGAIQAQEAIRMLCPGVWGEGGIAGYQLTLHADTFQFTRNRQIVGKPVTPIQDVRHVQELSAHRTTLRQAVLFARQVMGPSATVDLGFDYCPGRRCSHCGYEDRQPFKLGTKSHECPECLKNNRTVYMTPPSVYPSFLGGSQVELPPEEGPDAFWDTTLEQIGVPLYDILTFSVYEYDENGRDHLKEQAHYALAGDAEAALGWIPKTRLGQETAFKSESE